MRLLPHGILSKGQDGYTGSRNGITLANADAKRNCSGVKPMRKAAWPQCRSCLSGIHPAESTRRGSVHSGMAVGTILALLPL